MLDQVVSIVVVGSIHIDLIVKTLKEPFFGETVKGVFFEAKLGGKAANQAVAASRYGISSFLVGKVGKDYFGVLARKLLRQAGVNCFQVSKASEHTGIGHVCIGPSGEYRAVIVPGANACLSEKDIEAVLPTFQRSNLLLIQGEIPLELSLFAARKAKELGLRVMFNAAPVPPKLDLGVLKELQIDFLVANSVEAGQIVNLEVKDFEGAKRAALEIADYVPCVIVTLSSEGILAFENGDLLRANAFGVEVADTLGAGDAFVGVLGARIAEGFGLEESIPHALAAGALAVTRVGAYAPTRRELEEFLNLRRKEVNIIRVPVKN